MPPCGTHDASTDVQATDVQSADAVTVDVVDASMADVVAMDVAADVVAADVVAADVVAADSGRACPAGSSLCGGMCVNVLTNSSHCGACDKVCPAMYTCMNGSCVGMGTCTAPFTQCGTSCVNTATNTSHCGMCNNACGATQSCVNGSCVNNGALRFTLTWSAPGDVDLHVAAPCGMTLFHMNRMACEGTLDRDDRVGTGPENIVFTSSAARGDYHVCAVPFNITTATTIELNIWEGSSLVRTIAPATGMSTSMPNPPPCTPSSPFFLTTYTY